MHRTAGRVTRAVLAAVTAVLFAPSRSNASVPEQYGPLAVQEATVQIPVPLDPSGPEGVFPFLNAEFPAGGKVFGQGWGLCPSRAWSLAARAALARMAGDAAREFRLSGWARRLASRGFIVIVSDRRGGSTGSVWPVLDRPSDVFDLSATVNSEDILRVLRWAIVEGETAHSFLYGKVDTRHLAIGGPSLGAHLATFAALRSLTEGPRLSALVLLDPSDERLGQLTYESSLAIAPSMRTPTIDLASEEHQHPIQCNMDDGSDCTLVANQEYAALTGISARLGLKVPGSVHEDVEDPKTTSNSPVLPQMYERCGMAWLEYWLTGECAAARYLGGPAARADARAGRVVLFAGGTPAPVCPG